MAACYLASLNSHLFVQKGPPKGDRRKRVYSIPLGENRRKRIANFEEPFPFLLQCFVLAHIKSLKDIPPLIIHSLLCSIQFYPDPRAWNARPGACLSHAAEIAGRLFLPSFVALLLCSRVFLVQNNLCWLWEPWQRGPREPFPNCCQLCSLWGASPCGKAFGRLPGLVSCHASL